MKATRVLVVTLLAGSLFAQTQLDRNQLRNDLFAAMAGNAEALNRIFGSTEKVLRENPDHAQALVWHGAATMGRFFVESQAGDPAAAMRNVQSGVTQMDRAVSLAPNDIEVRIIRAVIYNPASRELPPGLAEGMLEKARTDLQHTFDMQQSRLTELGTHPLGELLQALGDVYSRQGKADDAEKYYRMIQTMLKDTEYAKRAGEWMKTRQPLPESQTDCVGCHNPNRG
jgi:tetratricopeptide (TPR) repeat protein